MGNEDGILSVIANQGNNDCLNGKGYYFSFAYGNEIALYIDGSYYILNCGSGLWDKVTKFMKKKRTLKEAKAFWYKEKKGHEVSEWSADFEGIKGKEI